MSSSDSGFDLRALENVDKNFLSNLKSAVKLLQASDADKFFKIVLNHFEKGDLNPEVGISILQTVRKLLTRDDILNVFRSKDVVLRLPYELNTYTDCVYDILYDVLLLDSEIFSDDVARKDRFGYLLQENPRKGLALIAKVAKRYVEDDESLINPWPCLDTLVKQTNLFARPDVIPSFISVVVYLCQSSEQYAESRMDKCWSRIVGFLDTKDSSYLRSVYAGLCYLRDEFKKVRKTPKLPLVQIKDHLSFPEVQGPALALLVDRANENPSDIADDELISKLFQVAERDHNLKATIVLMKLAASPKIAKDVLGNGSWLLSKLPEAVDTLRLFLVIFKHNELRAACAECKNFIPFLKFVIEELGSSGVITISCTIIRRIPLDEKFVQKMAEKGLVKTFIDKAKATDDDTKVSSHSLLLFLNTVAEYTYLDEFLDMVKIVVDRTTNDQNLCEIASYVAVTFAKYPQLREKMVALRLDKFFAEKRNDKKYKRLSKNAEKFLKLVE
ncbi:hypothetical protein TRFO_23033 [Tritrichomonas foetus]|uniref:Uncharacterized protein n=1 Tax=Tritrichomonas foetus TaxID=1144522 RepID=A0A1J4KFN0_9EUKA|nr:hypothetical protein TRFO_23033 [Tritrichomonas foetus]|eukprot:OHT08438.1 hypothetical protein TRFO_23033 [Tritrichomonas foetus]